MPTHRTVSYSRLKPECVQEYVRWHQQVWPELLEAYRKAGITQISCFLGDLDLVVYSEYDTEVYEKEKESLRRNPVEIRWQALMKTLRDPKWPGQELQQVFYMPPVGKEKPS